MGGFVPQISQIYTDFLHHDFSSSDFTDESEGILACRITHGFSQNFGRWPMARALYMLLLFFVTQISLMTQIFSHGIFFHRMPRNLFGGFLLRRLLTDFRRCDLSGRCRYPLRLDKEIHQRFHRKSVYICEICGTKPSNEEKSASSAKSA